MSKADELRAAVDAIDRITNHQRIRPRDRSALTAVRADVQTLLVKAMRQRDPSDSSGPSVSHTKKPPHPHGGPPGQGGGSTPDTTPASITVSPPTLSLIAGGQPGQLAAVVKNAAGETLARQPDSWRSDNEAVATVAGGTVTGLQAGAAVILALLTSPSLASNAVLATVAQVGDSTPPPEIPPSPSGSFYAERPRTRLATAVADTPSPGATLRCGPGKPFATFAAAWNAANRGDTILILPGVILSENAELAPRSGSNWVTVKTDLASFLPEGQRLTPTDAATYNLARIRSPNTIQSLSALADSGFARFIGVEFDVDPTRCKYGSGENSQGIVRIGDGSVAQNDLAHVPTDWIFDRCYFHGTEDQDIRKALSGDGARIACVDSWFDMIRSTFDAQCFAVTNGPGPFKLLNCYFAASGENVAFGGASPGIANLVPSDIEIRRCHFNKPRAWQADGRWNYKNLIECKNGKYAEVVGCVFTNSWRSGQQGFGVVLWTADQQNNADWTETSHWTFEYCDFRACSQGFQLTALSKHDPAAGGVPMHHVTLRHCLGRGIGDGILGSYYQISDAIAQLVIEHMTGFGANDNHLFWGGQAPLTEQIIRYNIGGAWRAMWYAGGTDGLPSWTIVAGPGAQMVGNVWHHAAGFTQPVPGNYFPSTSAAIGFAGGDVAYNPNASIADFKLLVSSPYKGTADNGTDPGVDIDALLTAIDGVEAAA